MSNGHHIAQSPRSRSARYFDAELRRSLRLIRGTLTRNRLATIELRWKMIRDIGGFGV